MELDLSKITNIEFGDVDTRDYPDFCDTYIISADYNGRLMTEKELEVLNEHKYFVHEQLFNRLF